MQSSLGVRNEDLCEPAVIEKADRRQIMQGVAFEAERRACPAIGEALAGGHRRTCLISCAHTRHGTTINGSALFLRKNRASYLPSHFSSWTNPPPDFRALHSATSGAA